MDLPRIPLPTTATSAQLAELPALLRQHALFSARLSLADPLAEIGRSIEGILGSAKSASEARRDIRQALDDAGYLSPSPGEGGGGLLDHRSAQRLNLILEQNVRSARNYGSYAAGMDPLVLDEFPAQELIRIRRSSVERPWSERWRAAGGTIYRGRMVAVKGAPVWTAISRFGTPWPPFDYSSGMGVIDVGRDEAERLGVLAPDQPVEAAPLPFAEPSRSVAGIDTQPGLLAAVLQSMGGAARVVDGVLSLLL